MQIWFLIFMFVLGAAMGSFLCCQARRMQAKDLKKPVKNRRSVCMNCRKKLAWYDNIPIISWLLLRGKCRKCHKKIGALEIVSEIATALGFLAIATTINVETAGTLEWVNFATIIIYTIIIIFLGIYDGMCGELPMAGLTASLVFAIIAILPNLINHFSIEPFLSALTYGGIYLVLYLVSKGKWVGDGDWLLATSIGLVLGKPWLAMVALFVANLSACIVMLPTMKGKKNHQIYFGPFLTFSFVAVYALMDVLNAGAIAITSGTF